MKVIGIRQNPGAGSNGADEVHGLDALPALLPQADIVALTCPLTPATEGLMSAAAIGLMKPSAYLVNCARGRVVDEAALVAALQSGAIAAAGIDVTVQEPLPPDSPLWSLPNALVTPHTAGETRRYEVNVMDMLMENLDRLYRGETALLNQVV
jgi:phosphoglycerate dehydrogenase-like enzyme